MRHKKGIVLITLIVYTMLFSLFFCTEVFAATKYNIYKDKDTYYSGDNDRLIKVGVYSSGKGEMGNYPTRKGVILITSSGSIANVVGHAAIVYTSGSIIEALSGGVCMSKNNWNTTKSTVAAVTVRSTNCRQDRLVAGWCKSKLGKKYNYNYYNTDTRDKFYCSHLIWAGYKEKCNIDLNTKKYDLVFHKAVGPFEFISSNSTSDTFIIYLKNWNK